MTEFNTDTNIYLYTCKFTSEKTDILTNKQNINNNILVFLSRTTFITIVNTQ